MSGQEEALRQCLEYLETHEPDPSLVSQYAKYDDIRGFPVGTLVTYRDIPTLTPHVVCHHQNGTGNSSVITSLDGRHAYNAGNYFPEHGTWSPNNKLEVIDLSPAEDEVQAAIESILGVGGQREDET